MDATIRNRYAHSTKRLFLLDYDGTLVGFTPRPEDSIPSREVIKTLRALSADPMNTVVIVSGRDNHTLDRWLGSLPLEMIAEHGYTHRDKTGHWHEPIAINATAWKPQVRKIMNDYVSSTPGSFIEEKASALVWHFGQAESAQITDKARDMESRLAPVALGNKLKIMHGHEIVEVLPAEIGKGAVATLWLGKQHWDFVLTAGDDTTDEDLFAAMPEEAYTIKVRPGTSRAKYTVRDTSALLLLLDSLSQTSQPD